MTLEKRRADMEQSMARQTEEQNAVMKSLDIGLEREKVRLRDMPEGTVCTDPYYTDYPVLVFMK